MENRVNIHICGADYTLTAEESPSYMEKVAAYVNDKMTELMASNKVGRTDAAILAALNIADELMKEKDSSEHLRTQIKGYLDDAAKAQNEVSELKREIFKLQNRGGNGAFAGSAHGSSGNNNSHNNGGNNNSNGGSNGKPRN